MNIYALKGHKVICNDNLDTGYKQDSIRAKYYLEVGKVYTVEHTEVSNTSTYVWLEEIPNKSFNSIYFEDVDVQSEEMDKEHLDYLHYH